VALSRWAVTVSFSRVGTSFVCLDKLPACAKVDGVGRDSLAVGRTVVVVTSDSPFVPPE